MLSKKKNHIKTKKIFNHNILKITKKKSLLANKHKLDIIICIMKNDKKEFLIEKKIHIFKN